MTDMLSGIIMNTPYIWQSLGFVSALSVFISPLLYNGDRRTAWKSMVVILGYAFFASFIIFSYLTSNGYRAKLEPAIVLLLVAVAYSVGLTIGIEIHKLAVRSYEKKSH